MERRLGVELPDEGLVRVTFDDSIITDTTAKKRQDMDEVAAGLLEPWEYRIKWRGEDEATVRGSGHRPVGPEVLSVAAVRVTSGCHIPSPPAGKHNRAIAQLP